MAAPGLTHEGRVAVITGAARGLGQAMAKGLAARGASVVGVDLLELDGTKKAVEGLGRQFLGVRADVTSEEDVKRVAREVLAKFGKCDILINNATSVDRGQGWEELDLATWRRVMSVNLDAQFLMCRELMPMMKAQRWGRVVNITSSTTLSPAPTVDRTAYRTSKMGVIGLTRALATQVGQYGITVNCTSPTLTATPGLVEGEPKLKEMIDRLRTTRPIQKHPEPEDILGVILFLTGEESYFVTGQTVLSDGGASYP